MRAHVYGSAHMDTLLHPHPPQLVSSAQLAHTSLPYPVQAAYHVQKATTVT